MHYYPYPFRDTSDDGRPPAEIRPEQHEADAWADRVICLFVGLLCLGALSAIA